MKSDLNSIEMIWFQRDVPFLGEIHSGRVCFLVLDKTDAHNDLVFVSQEETNRLEPARVTGPPSRTRDASRKEFITISMRHTPRKLKFRVQFPTVAHLNGRMTSSAVVPKCGRSF
jgi:hypothetical protein